MGIKALIFDLGNTLIYFDGHWPEVYAAADRQLVTALQDAGLALDSDAFVQEFRQRLEQYYQERDSEFIEHTTGYLVRALLAEYGFPDVPDAVLDDALAQMYAASQAHWLPEADAVPTLKMLHDMGYRLGLISNASNDADVQFLVDKCQVRPYLDFVVSSAVCGVRKPDPRIFELAMEDWSFAPDEVAMVGDTLGADVLGAAHSGLFSIWITRRGDTPANAAHRDTIHPDATVATLEEIIPLVQSLS